MYNRHPANLHKGSREFFKRRRMFRKDKIPAEVFNSLAMIAPKQIYIGVDPAFRAGGFWAAILDRSEATVTLKNFDTVLDWHDWLRTPHAPLVAFVLVENSNAQNITFRNFGNRGEVARKSRNVGTNQAASELAFISATRRYTSRFVFDISPTDKGTKITDDGVFQAVLRQEGLFIQGRTNQDQRDAVKLALMLERKVKMAGLLQIKEPVLAYNPAND